MTPPPPKTIISRCRLQLAKELAVEPEELRLCGNMYGPDYRLILFTVEKPGSPLNHSTRSVKVYP